MERLDKLLSNTGRWSRKQAKELIKGGRVRIDGEAPKGPEEKVPEGAAVTVDGKPVFLEKFVYIMLHKPAGLISSTDDPRGETVLSCLPSHMRKIGLFPVGRLDKDTEGLLILTNDGPLAHRLLAPNRHVDKLYDVEVEGSLNEEDQKAFREGITLIDGTQCRPAELEIMEGAGQALVTLREGKYHQVKRMLASRGKPVTYLKRLAMGPISLDSSLPPGAWRPLTPSEMALLDR